MDQGSLQNEMLAHSQSKPDFTVGDGATLLHYTDRYACTVIAISHDRRIVVVQEDTATRTDTNGMSESQDYSFTRNLEGVIHIAVRRRDGTYKADNSTAVVRIGERLHYRDFSF